MAYTPISTLLGSLDDGTSTNQTSSDSSQQSDYYNPMSYDTTDDTASIINYYSDPDSMSSSDIQNTNPMSYSTTNNTYDFLNQISRTYNTDSYYSNSDSNNSDSNVVDVNADLANNSQNYATMTIGNTHYNYGHSNLYNQSQGLHDRLIHTFGSSYSNNPAPNTALLNAMNQRNSLLQSQINMQKSIANQNFQLGEDQINANKYIADKNFQLGEEQLDAQKNMFQQQLDFYNKQEQDKMSLLNKDLQFREDSFNKQYQIQQQQLQQQAKLIDSQIDIANKNFKIAQQQWQTTLSEINHMKAVRTLITNNFNN